MTTKSELKDITELDDMCQKGAVHAVLRAWDLTRAPVLERLGLQYLAQHPHLLDPAALTERTEKEG